MVSIKASPVYFVVKGGVGIFCDFYLIGGVVYRVESRSRKGKGGGQRYWQKHAEIYEFFFTVYQNFIYFARTWALALLFHSVIQSHRSV